MDLNSYFVSFKNQYHKNTLQKLYRANPYQGLVDREQNDLSEGLQPTIRTYTSELPTSYPTSLTEVALSNGTGDPACSTPATTVKRGEIHRTWKLYKTAFRTDTLCLSDLKRSHDAAEAVAAFEKALSQYVTVWWSDYARLQAMAMVDNKVSLTDDNYVDPVVSTKGDFTDVAAIPTKELGWEHLDQIYVELCRDGLADEYAVGRTENGKPVIPIILGWGYYQKLFRDNQDKREQIKYFDPKSNLKVLGYDGAINGWLPIVDLFPVRFGSKTLGSGGNEAITAVNQLTLANTVYPTINANATVGRKSVLNPKYRLSTIGTGVAQFEVINVLPRNVFKMQFEPSSPTAFAGADFMQQNYLGEFEWINNRTFEGDNDKGNKGYWSAEIIVGAKPLFPELGYTILAKALKR